jgi:two-component system, chemotaxis family, chemotaxis protein CheY
MRLYLDYTSKGRVLYDYAGIEFLSTNDAYNFAAETADALKNQLDSDWTGWSIEVRNADGRKYFTLSLDAAESIPVIDQNDSDPEPATKPNDSSDQAAKSPCRLLIVEDAAVHSAVIDRIAAKIGFTTSKAHSYEAAFKALSARQFDCITLDLGLGEHVGLDVLRHLSTIQCRAQIIVISQSDKDTCNDVVELGRALDLNVCEALPKPIDLGALRNMLMGIRRQSCSPKPASTPV